MKPKYRIQGKTLPLSSPEAQRLLSYFDLETMDFKDIAELKKLYARTDHNEPGTKRTPPEDSAAPN